MISKNNYRFALFLPTSPQLKTQLKTDPFCLQTNFSTQINSQEKLVLMLTNRYLVVCQRRQWRNKPLYYTQLNFELKFQVIYKEEGKLLPTQAVHSPKVGLRFFRQDEHPCECFLEGENLINIWIKNLNRHLNQYGFHHLYKGIKRLGKGSSATVYQVQRATDKQRFAVKAFAKDKTVLSQNVTNRIKLINELSTLRKFDHPNIIKLEAIFESQNSIYVILELLQGGSLQSLINSREGVFSLSEIKELTLGLARGLQEMHGQRIMHRDIKPQNIMLRNNSTMQPVIVDFGLSTNVDAEDYIHYRCGTPGYVAPEIISLKKGIKIQPQCDIFSAGAILHTLLTKHVLFQGATCDQVYKTNHHLQFDLSGPLYKHINPQAMDLLHKMLLINPAQRITASKMVDHALLRTSSFQMQIEKYILSPVTSTHSSNAHLQVMQEEHL